MTIRAATFRTAKEAVDFLNDNNLWLEDVHGPSTNSSGFVEIVYDDSAAVADLLGSSSAPVTINNAYDGTLNTDLSAGVSTIGQEYFLVWVYVTNASSAARLDLQIEVAESKTASLWTPLQAEDVTSGAATQDDYEIKKAFSGTGLILAAPIPVRGVPAMRVKIKSDAGTPQVYVRYSTK